MIDDEERALFAGLVYNGRQVAVVLLDTKITPPARLHTQDICMPGECGQLFSAYQKRFGMFFRRIRKIIMRAAGVMIGRYQEAKAILFVRGYRTLQ